MRLDSSSYVFFGVSGVLLTPVSRPVESVDTFLFVRRRIRSPDAIHAALNRALGSSTSGLPVSFEWDPAHRGIATRLFENLGFDRQAETLSRDLCDPQAGHSKWSLAPGAVAALELLRRRGIRMAVVSGVGDALEDTLDAVGILTYFDEILNIEESPSERRDAELFQAVLSGLGLRPESAWFIGSDSEPAVPRVERAGLGIFLITPEPEPRRESTRRRARRVDKAVHLLLDGDS